MTERKETCEDINLGWLHIYGQSIHHADATIIGNRKALEILRSAIDNALSGKVNLVEEVYASDGEGYHVNVKMVNLIDSLGEPEYTACLAIQNERESTRALWEAAQLTAKRLREANEKLRKLKPSHD